MNKSSQPIRIVVADDDHGFPARLQLGQDVVVEDVLEYRILVRSPFVEKIDIPVFEEGRQQRQALALTLGELHR